MKVNKYDEPISRVGEYCAMDNADIFDYERSSVSSLIDDSSTQNSPNYEFDYEDNQQVRLSLVSSLIDDSSSQDSLSCELNVEDNATEELSIERVNKDIADSSSCTMLRPFVRQSHSDSNDSFTGTLEPTTSSQQSCNSNKAFNRTSALKRNIDPKKHTGECILKKLQTSIFTLPF